MASPTSDADQQWWDIPVITDAVAAGRWDTVLRAATSAGVTQQDIATACGLSQPYVSRIASGTRVPRQQDTIAKLCDGLGIPRRYAGLADSDEETATDRRDFLTLTGLTAASTVIAAVPHDALADLGAPTATYRRADAHTASSLLRPPVTAHLAMLRHMAVDAERDRRTADVPRLHALISEAAGFAAWLAHDADDRATARRSYMLAVESAERTRQTLLSVYMIGSMASFAAVSGDAFNAKVLVARARAALPRSAPPIASTWLDCVEASILATAGDEHAFALLDSAGRKLTAAEPVWPWLMRFDAAKLDTYRATVAVRLRRDSHRWPPVVHPMTATHPKQAADRTIERADALADLGQPEPACLLAAAVFDTARRFRSERLTRAVIDLRTRIGDGVTGREVEALDARLATMYEME